MEAQQEARSPRPNLKITAELMASSIPADSGHCAIADAVTQQVKGATHVSVDLQTIRWTDQAAGKRYVFLTPARGQQFLLAFDRGIAVEPFTLRLPQASQVIPIKAKSKAERKTSAERREALEAKQAAGEELSATEQRSLSGFRSAAKRMGERTVADMPVTETPPTLHAVGDAARTMTKVGGRAPGAAVLAHGPGRRRIYGIGSAGVPDILKVSETPAE